MKLIKATIFLCMTAILLSSTAALALPIVGDEVRMENDWVVPYQLTDINDNITYFSFCLEKYHYFTPGSVYTVTSVGDYAENGGLGAIDGKDEVSVQSKWLYAAFMSGFLGDKTDTTLAEKVQNAIWFLEEEILNNADWSYLKTNYYSGNENLFNNWTVVAVNIETAKGYDAQSQLIGIAPVPEPATLLLLGTGLVGIASLRRKKSNQK